MKAIVVTERGAPVRKLQARALPVGAAAAHEVTSGPGSGSGSGSGLGPGAGPGAGQALLFLREEQLRVAQELLFFAYRDFTGVADSVLAEAGLGRAHHRALHFIGARPGVTVTELLSMLRITKQSLARVLSGLLEEGYVEQRRGTVDRRQKHLALTAPGQALERRLFECQRELLVHAFSEAGVTAVEGFRRVLTRLSTEASSRGPGELR